MITLTDKAQLHIAKQLQRRGSGIGLRLGVKPTGCSGFQYVLEYVDSQLSSDVVVVCGQLSVFIDPKDLPYIVGMTLDYVRKGLNEGFEFINPLERSRCGCGESFQI